jgi:hypothetical protein
MPHRFAVFDGNVILRTVLSAGTAADAGVRSVELFIL